jgi:hypothetical protein
VPRAGARIKRRAAPSCIPPPSVAFLTRTAKDPARGRVFDAAKAGAQHSTLVFVFESPNSSVFFTVFDAQPVLPVVITFFSLTTAASPTERSFTTVLEPDRPSSF